MKYDFMATHRGEHRVEKMAENLGVTRSGFYAWLRRGRAARQAADEHLRELIEGIQAGGALPLRQPADDPGAASARSSGRA